MLLATIVSVAPFGHRPRPGTGGAFLVLVAFLISFLAIRTSARLTRSVSWWPGGVKSGRSRLPAGTSSRSVTVILGLAVRCFLKGRVLFGVIGVFIPVVAFVGAVRLAHPSSPWARWRYGEKRLDEARTRFDPARRAVRWQRRLRDLVAGAPTAEDDS